MRPGTERSKAGRPASSGPGAQRQLLGWEGPAERHTPPPGDNYAGGRWGPYPRHGPAKIVVVDRQE